DPQLLHEGQRLVRLELAELHLDPRRERVDHPPAALVATGDAGHDLGLTGDIALAHVEQDEDRFLGEEAEASKGLFLVAVQLDIADRGALDETGMEPGQDRLLALVRLALGWGAVATGCPEPLETPLGDGQVGQDELEIEPLEVPPGG